MNHPSAKFIALCIGIVLFTSAPIWGVQYFINQDGSGHAHTAWTMLELLRNEPRVVELYRFNLLTFPNVTGHWIQAASLLFVSPFVSTKLMLSLTYLGFVASIVWLRWCTAGPDGLGIAALVASVLGFNWLWLVGAYNFTIGISIAFAAVGLYYRWRQELTAGRVAALTGLAVLAFLSHIVAFLVMGAAVATICLVPFRSLKKSKLGGTALVFLPAVPLVLLYAASTEAGGTFYPIWRRLSDPYAIPQWIDQVRTVDSLYLIRRTALPFIEIETPLFLMFAPFAWLAVALALLIIPTLRKRGFWSTLPFVVLAFGFIVFSFFAPDDLQYSSSTGGLMRQRLFLVGLAFMVPIFRVEHLSRGIRTMATGALSFVIVFQTVALWEYAIRSDRDAREFFSASNAIAENSSIAAIVIEPKTYRFVVSHMNSINNYNAIIRRARTWDNYEFAHFLFPITVRNKHHQEFVMRFGSTSGIDLSRPETTAPQQIATLAGCLESTDPMIDTLLVWGRYDLVDSMVKEHFDPEPVFTDGRVRVFRRQ